MNNLKSTEQLLSRAFITVLLLMLLFFSNQVPASTYKLVIIKSTNVLIVKNDEQIIKAYRIASGKGGHGTKREMGDNKTPVGSYKIMELRENSRFHFFMQINYPNILDAWYGYNNNIINGKEFKEIVKAINSDLLPPQDTSLGGYIGLHGLGEITEEKLSIHDRLDWTEGCIALTNEEISELRQYVSIGTTITIKD